MSDNGQHFVADHVAGLPRSGIRDFFAIVAAMPQAISLGIGEPDFVTPWHIREAAIFALEKGKTSYTDNLGLIRLRREISTYVENNFGISYHPETDVLVAVGVSEALDIALRAVLNPGDKVLYHEPCYVSYSRASCLRTPNPSLWAPRLKINSASIPSVSKPHGNQAARYSCSTSPPTRQVV